MEKKYSQHSSGQILLITLLVLTIGMTIALALIGQTRTNVSIGNEIEDSARAFGAAEAGVEEALRTRTQTTGPQTLTGGLASYSTIVTTIGGQAGSYAFNQKTKAGDTETLWLVDHNADGSINENRVYTSDFIYLCWKGMNATQPALVASVLFKRGTGYYVAKAAFDPDDTRNNSNLFSNASPGTNGCNQTNVNQATITFSALSTSPALDVDGADTLIALRLRPVYEDAYLYVDSPVQLPAQGDAITSTGSTNTGVNRKIVVTRQFRSAPSIFDAAVVSQTDFSH